jgi:hypothetical protein
MASRLLPSDKFTDDTLIEAMIDGMLASDFSQILAVTPFAFKNFDKDGTSINPAWRNAVWHVRTCILVYFAAANAANNFSHL